MTQPQLILTRYTELLMTGNVEQAVGYLADDVIYNTWLGVVEGKSNVITFLRDNVRYLHHTRSFNKWRQVQHTIGPGSGSGAAPTSSGYDSEGFATFQHDGKIGFQPKYYVYNVPIKETIVIRGDQVVLVSLVKRL